MASYKRTRKRQLELTLASILTGNRTGYAGLVNPDGARGFASRGGWQGACVGREHRARSNGGRLSHGKGTADARLRKGGAPKVRKGLRNGGNRPRHPGDRALRVVRALNHV